MNKEEMLRKGFSHGAANVAIRYADEEIDFLVLRSEMVEYARRHHVEVDVKEIEDYVKAQFKDMHDALKDFEFPPID